MRFLSIAIYFFLNIASVSLFSQKYHESFKKCKVDTIHLFSPIGFIGVPGNRQIIPNDSLTAVHDIYLDSLIKSTKTAFINQQRKLTSEEREYFIDLIYRLSILEDRIFTTNTISQKIIDSIDKVRGRYIGIMMYSGYEYRISGEVIVASAMMLSASLLISGGTFWATYIPKSSFYKLHLAVFDKREKCILYYNESEIRKSFSKPKVVPKSIYKCLKGLKSCKIY